MTENKNKSEYIQYNSHACGERSHDHSHEHDEHCGCGDNHFHHHDAHKHSEKCGNIEHKHDNLGESNTDLYAASDEIPGIFSDEIEIQLRNDTRWGAFTGSLVNWVEESRLWLRSSGFLIGHIKIFAAGTNSKTLWLATTGKSLNAKYSPELQSCKDESLDSCRLSMTFIAFKIEEDRLKKEVVKRLEENIGIYKA